MKLAIMQPYIFPYLGYFQLLSTAETFVFLDDVAYIKRGWINRNRIRAEDKETWFTVPVRKVSTHTKISEAMIADDMDWRLRISRQLEYAYRDAPYRNEVLDLVLSVLDVDTEHIAELAKRSVITIINYLNCNVNLVWTSAIYGNGHLKGQDRVIDICKRNDAATYINASGGRHLYDASAFTGEGISLEFLKPAVESNCRLTRNTLSIIDTLMHHSVDEVCSTLKVFKPQIER